MHSEDTSFWLVLTFQCLTISVVHRPFKLILGPDNFCAIVTHRKGVWLEELVQRESEKALSKFQLSTKGSTLYFGALTKLTVAII